MQREQAVDAIKYFTLLRYIEAAKRSALLTLVRVLGDTNVHPATNAECFTANTRVEYVRLQLSADACAIDWCNQVQQTMYI